MLRLLNVDIGQEEGGIDALQDLLNVVFDTAKVDALPVGLLKLLGQGTKALKRKWQINTKFENA